MFRHALVRIPGPNLADGLSTSDRGKPDYQIALRQHERYVDALRGAGVTVDVLDPLPDYPDAHFVEDVALVTPELAVITRPGAEARRGEEDAIEQVLARYRHIVRIREPATLDGGDVLIVGRQVFIGISQRTNEEGARQLGEILAPCGYASTTVPVGSGLHLKSSVNVVAGDALLIANSKQETMSWGGHLAGFRQIVVDEGDEYAANSLWVNDRILMPIGYPRSLEKLAVLETRIVQLDMSEMRKKDGGVTCLSLRF